MDYEEIIEAIRQAGGGMSRDTAERAAQAPLQTLAERLPRGEAQYILQELPAELKPFIYTETDAEALDIDEFLSRVADREGTESRHARAVFAALSRALSPEAVEHLARRRHPEHRMPAAGEEHRDQLRLRSRQQPNGHGPRAAEPGNGSDSCAATGPDPQPGAGPLPSYESSVARPEVAIKSARPGIITPASEPKSSPPTGPAGDAMQPWNPRADQAPELLT
jgi:uncharacterized protein (DUF2267 family)